MIKSNIQIRDTNLKADVDQAIESARRSVALLRTAALVTDSPEWKPLFAASESTAEAVFAAVRSFLTGKELLNLPETSAFKRLGMSVKDLAKRAELELEMVEENARASQRARGYLEVRPEDLGALSEDALARALAEKADGIQRPHFSEYQGRLLVMRPGTKADRQKRVDAAIADWSSTKAGPARSLHQVGELALGRARLSEAQVAPVLSVEEILADGRARALAKGYKAGSIAVELGFAIADRKNFEEIGLLARHLVDTALKAEDIHSISDDSGRVAAAKDRARGWIQQYTSGERVIADAWALALDQVAAQAL